MKILVFGSSYCRDICEVDKVHNRVFHGINVEFIHRFFPGKSFEYFLETPSRIDTVLSSNPDYILVLFGGNSISTITPKKEILDNCRDFYDILYHKAILRNPDCKIVASQVPLRFVNKRNRHHTPFPKELKKIVIR